MEAHIEKEEGRRFGDIEFPENVLDDSRFDSCNYFLHNHKDETDVRFLNWTEFVFVKFQDFAATKRFVSLSYAMFYVSGLSRNDVESFLKKKKNVTQKEEVAMLRCCLARGLVI